MELSKGVEDNMSLCKTYIGIDNGATGSIGIISNNNSLFIETPAFVAQNYTKTKKNITRINGNLLTELIKDNTPDLNNCFVVLERPMVNPKRFAATTSALRALEATLIVIELLELPMCYIDSKEWQKFLLPKDLVGSDKLKRASMDIGCRLFPKHKQLITKHKDADGILIAEYARRMNW